MAPTVLFSLTPRPSSPMLSISTPGPARFCRLRRHGRGADEGWVRVQRRRRGHGVETEPSHQGLRQVPPGGRVAVVPAARSVAFMATQMLEAGVPIVNVSRRLAHWRVSTTMDHHAHSVPGRDARASATLRTVRETAVTETAATTTAVDSPPAVRRHRDPTWRVSGRSAGAVDRFQSRAAKRWIEA